MKLPYTIAIQWSEEDGCYLVHLLQFTTQQFHTHSDTYQEALSNAQEVLELLVEEYQQDGKPLPQPKPLVTVSQVAQSVRVWERDRILVICEFGSAIATAMRSIIAHFQAVIATAPAGGKCCIAK